MRPKPVECSVGVEPILNPISLPINISSPYLYQMLRKVIFFYLKTPINAKPSRYTFDIFRLNLCKLAS